MASEAASIMSNPFTKLQQQQAVMPHHQQQQAEEAAAPPPAKKKRNLPGTPAPDAEVIALSPRTLLATNRFVCEICGKGFQRDQNLQLHRRGHNLPWKLRQRAAGKEARKRVYVCPEKSCVHHNPARALGDLTGIKKHFCRKHGEKKWKCEKCAKKYAVQSDWKAHAKTCGTKEYRCDCGTIFSRRDSFITHRAFCDALAEETARLNAAAASSMMMLPPPAPVPPQANLLLINNKPPPPPAAAAAAAAHHQLSLWGGDSLLLPASMGISQLYADAEAAAAAGAPQQLGSWLYGGGNVNAANNKLLSSNASELTTSVPSVFSGQQQAKAMASDMAAAMSATALLHRAAQMGAVTSAADACMFAGHHQHATSNDLVTAAAYGDVLSAAVRHAGTKQDAAVVGRDETTRDFLGVGGVQPLCSTSLPLLHGWI
ncbi:unnamed protein product [Urochloa decumbens]|uniref:Protein EARLY HEADING DATE 2 n=1 Tax=Urochloa decumbens TaxID=240449 RepID=A0ABC8Z2J4_9POAL